MKTSTYVNEEKRTCVVVLTDFEDDVYRATYKLFRGRGFMPLSSLNSFKVDRIVGKAKCSPDDTFDAEFGLRIARTRALIKYKHKFNDVIWDLQENLDEVSSTLNDFFRDDELDFDFLENPEAYR